MKLDEWEKAFLVAEKERDRLALKLWEIAQIADPTTRCSEARRVFSFKDEGYNIFRGFLFNAISSELARRFVDNHFTAKAVSIIANKLVVEQELLVVPSLHKTQQETWEVVRICLPEIIITIPLGTKDEENA